MLGLYVLAQIDKFEFDDNIANVATGDIILQLWLMTALYDIT